MWGEIVLVAAATGRSVFAGAGWVNTAHWRARVTTIKITKTMVLASLIIPTSGHLLPSAAGETARRGRSATRRVAIVPESNSVDGLPGSDVINTASLSVAIFPGASVNLAASCQGSRSDRASVDRTVSGRPLLSSPTGANRKSSNSDESLDTGEGFVITTTRFLSSLFRIMKPVMQNDSTTVVSADPKNMLFGELRQDREIPNRVIRGWVDSGACEPSVRHATLPRPA